jgi:glycosyltransferase involved in cell wall biosynthesis
MSKLLLIGPRTRKINPEKTGGVIVLFEQLINELDQLGVEKIIIDANGANHKNKVSAFFSVIYQLLRNIRKVDHVSLHGTAATYLSVAPFAILISRLFGKTLSLRKFAGNFNQFYENGGKIRKKIIEYILKNADYSFFETKFLVEYFGKYNENTFWFPNVRERTFTPELPRSFNKRFVFISHVSKGKGIDQILEASKQLDASYTIDIYGPIMNGEYSEGDFKGYNVNYKGALKNKQVIPTLNKYDVLLLPSFRAEEGYPGIIIEAYSLGIPIISTSLKSIKEICDNGIEGLLVTPKSIPEMVFAIKYFTQDNYQKFSQQAFKKFEIFRSDIHTNRFLDTLQLVSQ